MRFPVFAPLFALAVASGAPAVAQAPAEVPPSAAAAPEGAAPADPATVVATVNGATITLGDLTALRGGLPQQYLMLPDPMLYDGLRDQLVSQTLLAQAAEAAGLAQDPGVARMLALQRQSVLAESWLRAEIDRRVTPEALQAAYAAQYTDVPPVREIRASHILVADEALANDLRARLDAGEDFAALAQEHGTDGTRDQGGDLGWFEQGMMVPEFADAAFALAPGETGGPVRTQFGWHLIRVTEARDRPAPAFDEVAEELTQTLTREAAGAVVDALRAAAAVEVPEDRPGLSGLRAGEP